jgi:spermidine synthase
VKPWELLDEEAIPNDSGKLQLFRRDQEYSIRVNQAELMNSRRHASEDALAQLACRSLDTNVPRILIGGLGMGFTLAEVLRQVPDGHAKDPARGEIIVAELVPAVVRWNRKFLGHLASNPLADPRVRVELADVSELIASASKSYDAVILDVDNGPNGLTHHGNEGLYSLAGLQSAYRALRPGGVLTVWSVTPDPSFLKRLRKARFLVEEVRVRARKNRGTHHWIWVAVRPKE